MKFTCEQNSQRNLKVSCKVGNFVTVKKVQSLKSQASYSTSHGGSRKLATTSHLVRQKQVAH